MKKGDLSINIIIVAAIALIILVIISVLVFRTGGQVSAGTSCEGVSGQCISDGEECSDIGYDSSETWIAHATAKCGQDQKCCVKLR
ncbi:MAG: hypothetical protein ACP5N2_06800 [Candidatus Nanoarchaeia archaeon]